MKTTFLVIAAVLGLVGIIIALTHEIKEVPDVKWITSYDFDNQDPYGYWFFAELLEELYDDVEVVKADVDFDLEDYKDERDILYIKLTNRFAPDSNYMNLVSTYLDNGNDALFLSGYIGGALATVVHEHDYYVYGWASDTALTVNWWDREVDELDTTATSYIHYNRDFEKGKEKNFRYLYSDGSDSITIIPNWLAMDQDSSLIYGQFHLDTSSFYLHVVPELFTNVALKQEAMLSNLEMTMAYFDPDVVILDNLQNRYSRSITGEETPMDYVLAQPSLMWAYYLVVLSLLFYALLRGRRRQKVIPLIPRYDNTSLDHVQMLADLYESQGQHNKLIGHMRQLFYHKMEQRYFLKPSHPDYVEKLSQKSKVPSDEIEILLNRFKKVSSSKKMNAYDLNVFYKTLQRFYDKCK